MVHDLQLGKLRRLAKLFLLFGYAHSAVGSVLLAWDAFSGLGGNRTVNYDTLSLLGVEWGWVWLLVFATSVFGVVGVGFGWPERAHAVLTAAVAAIIVCRGLVFWLGLGQSGALVAWVYSGWGLFWILFQHLALFIHSSSKVDL